MYIDRTIENKFAELLHGDKVILLLGARQVGKTTLIEPFIRREGGVLLNCDIEVDRARLRTVSSLTPQEAMQALGNPPLLVIDEAQNLPEIGRIVKGWYDSHVTTKIVLLGSSSLNLLDQTAEPLTGRNEKVFLTPLLFTELLRSQSWYAPQFTKEHLQNQLINQVQALLLQHIVFGGYPEAVTTADKEKYLLNLTSDYLLRDVLQSGLVKSPEPIRRLLALLAHQAGNKVNVSELASTLAIARPTVEHYLELLERSYVIFRVGAFSTNLRNEIGRDSKIFFWDTGVRNALLKEFSMSPLRSDIGSLFESWVMAEVAKQNLMSGGKLDIHFWRKKDGTEVDIVLRGTDTFKAYELKWSKQNATRGSQSFTNAYGIPVEIVTKDTVLDILN
jgi:predicted AAA+ superfamily ATPase